MKSGFSLLELLATVAILAIILGLVIPVTKMCLNKAAETRELSGARRAVEAWTLYAADNNGVILPGYKNDPATNARGQTIRFPTNARYVFRLAPYLNYALQGTLLVNKQARLRDDYSVSVAPSFGINLTFVGGDFGSGSDLQPTEENFAAYGKFVATRLPEIHSPAKLIVFASARFSDPTSGTMEGYNAIKSPSFTSRRWPDRYDEKKPYWDFGNVHLRHGGKAVCAMADGHVALLTYDELLDMRRWSNQAALAEDPNWTLPSL